MGLLFAGLLWPICGLLAKLLFAGRLEALTDADQLELGRAWVPMARRIPALAWLSRWVAAPAILAAKMRERFRTATPTTKPTEKQAPVTRLPTGTWPSQQ